jgi:molybdenum cofactor cytidylyltransferase
MHSPELEPVYVILAAGRASRMGFPKVFQRLGERAPLERIVAVLGERPFVIVTDPAHAALARAMGPRATAVVINDAPEQGMVHSLRLGLSGVEAFHPFGVILGDMPFLQTATLEELERALAAGADVVHPVNEDGIGGHPVLFASAVRARLSTLPAGDTLRLLRDEPSLRRTTVLVEDRGAFVDLDEPAQWEAARNA